VQKYEIGYELGEFQINILFYHHLPDANDLFILINEFIEIHAGG
jgi:hypothetical protein